jgi:hypothetical protein
MYYLQSLHLGTKAQAPSEHAEPVPAMIIL